MRKKKWKKIESRQQVGTEQDLGVNYDYNVIFIDRNLNFLLLLSIVQTKASILI